MIRTALSDATKRYGYALLLVGAAMAVTRLLDAQISPHTSPPYFLAVLFASILDGLMINASVSSRAAPVNSERINGSGADFGRAGVAAAQRRVCEEHMPWVIPLV